MSLTLPYSNGNTSRIVQGTCGFEEIRALHFQSTVDIMRLQLVVSCVSIGRLAWPTCVSEHPRCIYMRVGNAN
jgi:hypothetical protein